MVLGANPPIGPLAFADLVGLDTLLMDQDNLHGERRGLQISAMDLVEQDGPGRSPRKENRKRVLRLFRMESRDGK
jgi:3-hydroxyacyl-CoA dehydrogenase